MLYDSGDLVTHPLCDDNLISAWTFSYLARLTYCLYVRQTISKLVIRPIKSSSSKAMLAHQTLPTHALTRTLALNGCERVLP